MSQSDGSIIIDTKIDETGFNNGLKTMQSLAVKGIAAITAAIGAASVAVITLGSEFEQTIAKIDTLVDSNVNSIEKISEGILKLSTSTGQAATELSEATYEALSAGIGGTEEEIVDFVEKSTKLAKAGFTTTASAVDVMTTAINGYGLEVGDADDIANQLIVTQNLGKTTVNELASTLGRVIPTASAFSVNLGNVNASMAIMTASGIATAESSTYLKSMLNELGNTGSEVSKILIRETGKSFTDLMNEGKTLGDIMDILGGSVDNNATAFANLWGSQEAGTGALSILNAGTKKYNDTLNSVENSTTAVQDAYEKVTDTFQEKSKKVANSLKNVGIDAYSKFEKPLKGAMDSAQKSIEGLAKEMSNGKLGGSVDKIAEGFGDLIAETVDLASDVIPMLINGFAFVVDNAEMLTVATAGLTAAIIYNKNQVLIANTVESISAGLKTASATATLAYDVIQKTLAKDLTVTAAAHEMLNISMNSNPVGMVTLAIGALVAGLAALAIFTDDSSDRLNEQKTILEEYAVEQEKRIEQNKALQEQYDKQMSADLGQVENTKRLANELKTLVDANGQVKEGYEARASFILEQLNSAMGTEYSMIGNMVQGYDELSSSIDNMLVKMKTEAILNTQKKQYEDAVTNMDTYAENVKKAEDTLTTIKRENTTKIVELEKKRSEAIAMYGEDAAFSYEEDIKAHQEVIDEAQKQYDKEKISLQECLSAKTLFEENWRLAKEGRDAEIRTKNQADLANESESILTGYQNRYGLLEIQRDAYLEKNDEKYAEQTQKEMDDLIKEGLAKVAQQGINNDEDLNALGSFISAKQAKLNEMYNTDQTAWTEAQKQEAIDLQNSIDGNLTTYQSYVENKLAKAVELTESLNENSTEEEKAAVVQAREQAYNTLGIYAQNVSDKIYKVNYLRSEMDKGNKNITQDMVAEAELQAKKATEEYEKVAANTIEALESKKAEAAGIGSNYTSGFINGVKSLSAEVRNAGSWIGNVALKALKDTGLVKSPSRKTRETGGYYGEGFALGIEDKEKDVINASSTLGELAINTINDASGDLSSALNNTSLIDAFSSQFNSSQLNELLRPLEEAVLSSQYQMQSTVSGSVQHEILKSAEKQAERQPLKATINGVIESKLIIDGREFVAQLSPLISEELAFKTGR